MSNKPPSLDKSQAERFSERNEALRQTAAALNVLCCFDDPFATGGRRATYSAAEIARTIGWPRETVERSIAQLMKLGYLERTSGHRYRLCEQLLGETEIAASSLRHSRTARICIDRGKGTSSPAS